MNSYIRTIAKDAGKNSRFPEGNTERKITVGKASKLQWIKFLYGQIQQRKGKRENAVGINCALLIHFCRKILSNIYVKTWFAKIIMIIRKAMGRF